MNNDDWMGEIQSLQTSTSKGFETKWKIWCVLLISLPSTPRVSQNSVVKKSCDPSLNRYLINSCSIQKYFVDWLKNHSCSWENNCLWNPGVDPILSSVRFSRSWILTWSEHSKIIKLFPWTCLFSPCNSNAKGGLTLAPPPHSFPA